MGVVRVGVIGAGVIGERHCRVCANLPYIELVGVVDPDEARGRQVANLYETMYFPNHRALLFQIGAVAVAASTPVHCSLSAECLE
jgi:predicted dehydrogenase